MLYVVKHNGSTVYQGLSRKKADEVWARLEHQAMTQGHTLQMLRDGEVLQELEA